MPGQGDNPRAGQMPSGVLLDYPDLLAISAVAKLRVPARAVRKGGGPKPASGEIAPGNSGGSPEGNPSGRSHLGCRLSP